MERSPLLSPLQTASSQLKSTRIHSTVSSPGGVQHIRGYSRSPPPPTKPRSESHDRSFSDSRKRYDRSRSPERDDRNRPRDFPTGDRRRPPRAGIAAPIGRNGPSGSPPSEMGFQESRLKYRDRFPPRDPRFRSSESLKGTPVMGDHVGPPTGPSARHFASNSAPNTSTLSHSREFSPPTHYKGNFNDVNHNSRSMEYFPTGPAAGMGPGVGLGLGPMRYMDRDDWRGRPNQFSREFDRERDFRGRDIRQDIRDMRDLRAPRDPREGRDMREPPRDREWRDRDMAFNREVDPRDRDSRDPRDRDLREVGINTRDLRDREPRERGAWGAEVKGRDPLNNRDGPEMDVRELVERERERERERDRDRDRHRERPIWLHESEKEREGPGSSRASFDHGVRDRERDRTLNSRMTLAQELDRDLLAYAADKDKQSTEKTDDISIPDGPAASRAHDQPRSLSVHSLKESLPNGDLTSLDGSQSREQERYAPRDGNIAEPPVREHRDLDRHSSYRPDGAGLRMDFDGRPGRNISVGRRLRVLSAPSSEGPRYTESFDTGHPSHLARNSYPNSPAMKVGSHSEKTEKEENIRRAMELPLRRIRAESESIKLVPSADDLAPPRTPTDVEMQSPPSNVRVSTEDFTAKSPHTGDTKTIGPATTLVATEVPTVSSVVAAQQIAEDLSEVEKAASDIPETHPTELPTSDQNGPDVASTSSATAVLQDAKVKQEDSEPGASQSRMPSIPPQDMDVDEAIDTASVKEVAVGRVSQSPSITSQQLLTLSTAADTLDTQSPAEVEFENHADILVEIDKIDGTIQQYEDILASHRVKKEQDVLASSQVLLSQVDDEVPNVVDQSEMESVVEDSGMELEIGTETKHSELSTPSNAVEPASPIDLVPDRDTEDHGLDIVGSEDIDMGVGEPDVGVERHRQIAQSFSRQDLMAPIDETDPFLKRRAAQTRRPQLFDQIYAENNTKAKKYGRVHSALRDSSPHHRLQQPALQVFESIEDYPCYQENIDNHQRFRDVMLRNMAVKAAALDEKELALKREYKQHWEIWTKKVEKLDKLKEKMATVPVPANTREEDQVVGESVLFTSTRNRRGAYNSDAVRSEAELLEIIQSLENADMRNPDLRASRTAATVPPMILDPNIREKVHYYDMNHLVTDPAKYYRLGAVTDIWSEQEREIFIKRYMNYPKQFGKIAAGLEDKTASQCVLFYYREKKKIGFKEMLSNRGRKRKPAAGKRKEKPAQTASPSGQPGKKHKGSALIEDIGQANRTKMAKSKELRELQEMSSSWNDVEGEPGPRRRVRSGAANQAAGTPVPDETASNGASPAPSSALSTPVISAAERRKQRTRANNSRSAPASTIKVVQPAEEVVEEKKLKSERSASATSSSNSRKAEEEPLISVDSPGSSTTGTVSKATTLDPILTGAQELASGSVAFTVPGNPAASARWTTAEHAKAIEALKKFGRDFEAVAAAVGTKTVDQCRNFCFNYKRKFGVSALDDANSQSPTVAVEETDEKEVLNLPVEKPRGKKKVTSAGSVPGTPTTPTSAKDTAVGSGRRRAAKAAATVTAPEAIKDEVAVSPGLETIVTPMVEEVETTSDKRRRKRTSSKVEVGAAQADGATPATATSFRALYSRDPPSTSASPSGQGASPDSGAVQQTNLDGTTRRPNSSSYWSRQEKIDFARLLSIHGKDWDKISKAMKTKTLIQVRNHFSNHADKLSTDGFVGSEPSGSPLPTLKEETVGGMVDSEGGSGYGSSYTPLPESGPKTGFFATPPPLDGHVNSKRREETRSMSPPRRITNIGNLLNNDDEEVHVAAEDWFGNNEESGAQETSFEERRQRDRHYDHHHHQPPPRNGPPVHEEQRRPGDDEDVETEDELDRSRLAHGAYDTGYSGMEAPAGVQRRASETSIGMGGHGYPMSVVHDRAYYGQPAHGQHPSHQHPSHGSNGPGVLGSPYGGQHYYDSHPGSNGGNSGYRSPPPSGGAHGLHRVASPSHSLPPGPTSVVGQPPHYQQPYSHHQQHQRSSSIGHSEMIVARSHPSPQIGMRARSPLSNQGPYYSGQQQSHPHHGYSSSGSLYGYPPQHHPHPPRPMSEQPSMVLQHGHGHSRYSSPPIGGSRNGPGSPVHLEHSGSSGHISHRYSPVPTSMSVTSPRMSDASMHHHSHHLQQQPQVQQQHPHPQHHRRSSSPYQHHIPGQIASPAYLQGPPKQHSPSPRFAYSSATSPASLLPPPLPPSASSSSAPGPGYHPGQHIQQHPSGYGPASQSHHPR